MPLVRHEVYSMLKLASESEEVEEVLQAYCFSKYRAGNTDVQVLLKLLHLTQFLNYRNMHAFVSQHRDAIHCISCEVHHRAGGCIGSEQPQTALGKQAWAKARKPSGLALLRREWGRLDNVDMTGVDGCDGHLQGLGAVRRSGRVATEAVDAVRCLPSYESCCDSTHVVHPLPPFYWSLNGNRWMEGTKIAKGRPVSLCPPPYHRQDCICQACISSMVA